MVSLRPVVRSAVVISVSFVTVVRCGYGSCGGWRGRRSDRNGELGGVDGAPVLEVEEQSVGTDARGLCVERDVRAGRGDTVAGFAFGVHVQVGQVAGAQRDQVAVCAQVGIEIGDGRTVAGDRERQRSACGAEVAVEGDGVAVDRRRARRGRQCRRLQIAADVDVPAQGELAGSAARLEVGEHAIRAARGPGPVDRPCAVGPERGVDVSELAGVRADDDEGSCFSCRSSYSRTGAPSASRMRKLRVPAWPARVGEGDLAEGVAVLRDL